MAARETAREGKGGWRVADCRRAKRERRAFPDDSSISHQSTGNALQGVECLRCVASQTSCLLAQSNIAA